MEIIVDFLTPKAINDMEVSLMYIDCEQIMKLMNILTTVLIDKNKASLLLKCDIATYVSAMNSLMIDRLTDQPRAWFEPFSKDFIEILFEVYLKTNSIESRSHIVQFTEVLRQLAELKENDISFLIWLITKTTELTVFMRCNQSETTNPIHLFAELCDSIASFIQSNSNCDNSLLSMPFVELIIELVRLNSHANCIKAAQYILVRNAFFVFKNCTSKVKELLEITFELVFELPKRFNCEEMFDSASIELAYFVERISIHIKYSSEELKNTYQTILLQKLYFKALMNDREKNKCFDRIRDFFINFDYYSNKTEDIEQLKLVIAHLSKQNVLQSIAGQIKDNNQFYEKFIESIAQIFRYRSDLAHAIEDDICVLLQTIDKMDCYVDLAKRENDRDPLPNLLILSWFTYSLRDSKAYLHAIIDTKKLFRSIFAIALKLHEKHRKINTITAILRELMSLVAEAHTDVLYEFATYAWQICNDDDLMMAHLCRCFSKDANLVAKYQMLYLKRLVFKVFENLDQKESYYDAIHISSCMEFNHYSNKAEDIDELKNFIRHLSQEYVLNYIEQYSGDYSKKKFFNTLFKSFGDIFEKRKDIANEIEDTVCALIQAIDKMNKYIKTEMYSRRNYDDGDSPTMNFFIIEQLASKKIESKKLILCLVPIVNKLYKEYNYIESKRLKGMFIKLFGHIAASHEEVFNEYVMDMLLNDDYDKLDYLFNYLKSKPELMKIHATFIIKEVFFKAILNDRVDDAYFEKISCFGSCLNFKYYTDKPEDIEALKNVIKHLSDDKLEKILQNIQSSSKIKEFYKKIFDSLSDLFKQRKVFVNALAEEIEMLSQLINNLNVFDDVFDKFASQTFQLEYENTTKTLNQDSQLPGLPTRLFETCFDNVAKMKKLCQILSSKCDLCAEYSTIVFRKVFFKFIKNEIKDEEFFDEIYCMHDWLNFQYYSNAQDDIDALKDTIKHLAQEKVLREIVNNEEGKQMWFYRNFLRELSRVYQNKTNLVVASGIKDEICILLQNVDNMNNYVIKKKKEMSFNYEIYKMFASNAIDFEKVAACVLPIAIKIHKMYSRKNLNIDDELYRVASEISMKHCNLINEYGSTIWEICLNEKKIVEYSNILVQAGHHFKNPYIKHADQFSELLLSEPMSIDTFMIYLVIVNQMATHVPQFLLRIYKNTNKSIFALLIEKYKRQKQSYLAFYFLDIFQKEAEALDYISNTSDFITLFELRKQIAELLHLNDNNGMKKLARISQYDVVLSYYYTFTKAYDHMFGKLKDNAGNMNECKELIGDLFEYVKNAPGKTQPFITSLINITTSNEHKCLMKEYVDFLKEQKNNCEGLVVQSVAHLIDLIEDRSLEKIGKKLNENQKNISNVKKTVENTIEQFNKLDTKLVDQNGKMADVSENVKGIHTKLATFDEKLTEQDKKIVVIDDKTMLNVPLWAKAIASLLSNDWVLIAKRLNYTQKDVNAWSTQADPYMAVLQEWYTVNKSSEATDGFLKVLKELHYDQCVKIIEDHIKNSASQLNLPDETLIDDQLVKSPPQIFLSFEWGAKDKAELLNKYLKQSKFDTWADFGQMGGESRNQRIDRGLRAASVLICLVTSDYAKDETCLRQVNLAVTLNKPIIPLVIEKGPKWPPSGSLGPIFSGYLFIRFYQRPHEVTNDERYWPPKMLDELLMQLQAIVPPKVFNPNPTQVKDYPVVFISYNWDKQKQIIKLFDKLKSFGLTCWLDIKQMGGGDTLYEKIDTGIRNCQVMISCVTEKYALSANCRKEVLLADSISKPIIPIKLDPNVAYPPAGPMGPILGSISCIDFTININEQDTWNGESTEQLLKIMKPHLTATIAANLTILSNTPSSPLSSATTVTSNTPFTPVTQVTVVTPVIPVSSASAVIATNQVYSTIGNITNTPIVQKGKVRSTPPNSAQKPQNTKTKSCIIS